MSNEGEPVNLRLFIAVQLSAEWHTLLGELQREQERAVPGYFRWVRPELMHLTVVFLGWQPACMLTLISDLVRRAAAEVPCFDLALGSTRTFGPPSAPRVLWVETLQADGRLQHLRRRLERELQMSGLDFDQKPLLPHITLGRSKGQHRAAQGILRSRAARASRITVHEVVLMESQLARSGPSYIVRARAALGANPRATVQGCSGAS